MRPASFLVCLLIPAVASAKPYRAVTTNDVRIDREIGDGNGWVDDQEAAVARASYLVYRTTGLRIRPRLAWLQHIGGLETRDAHGPCVYIARSEAPERIAFTVFHEAGHVAYHHDMSRSSRANELQADEYEGRLVAATRGDIGAAIADARGRADRLHGSADLRAAAVLSGYVLEGGRLPGDVREPIATGSRWAHTSTRPPPRSRAYP